MHRPKPHGKTPNPKVKSKVKRKIIHSLWPRIVERQMWGARDGIREILRNYSDGLTEKEVKFLEQREQQLEAISKDLGHIYYRVKF